MRRSPVDAPQHFPPPHRENKSCRHARGLSPRTLRTVHGYPCRQPTAAGLHQATGGLAITDAQVRASALPTRTLIRLTPKIGRAHVELQSLMRISYAVFCLKKK